MMLAKLRAVQALCRNAAILGWNGQSPVRGNNPVAVVRATRGLARLVHPLSRRLVIYDLNQIAIFVSVVEQKGVRAAADKLGTAQSSVSRSISALESRLGARLFERSTRAFRVTEEGLHYYERCRMAMDGIAQADALVRSRRDELAGMLRVSVPVVLGKYLLSKVVSEFLIGHPRAHVNLEVTDRITDMVPEGVDLCVRLGPSSSDLALVSGVLARPSAGLYASAAYLHEHGVPHTPHDLPGHPTLHLGTLDQKPSWSLNRGGQRVTLPLTPILQTNDIPTLLNAAARACGICMVPHFVCQAERLPETLLQVLPEWEHAPVDVRALYPSHRSVTPLLRAFLNLLAERAPTVLNFQPQHGGEGLGSTEGQRPAELAGANGWNASPLGSLTSIGGDGS